MHLILECVVNLSKILLHRKNVPALRPTVDVRILGDADGRVRAPVAARVDACGTGGIEFTLCPGAKRHQSEEDHADEDDAHGRRGWRRLVWRGASLAITSTVDGKHQLDFEKKSAPLTLPASPSACRTGRPAAQR